MSFGNPWADNEDAALRILYTRGKTDREIANALIRRSELAVRARRIGMGLSRSAEWTDAQTDTLRQLVADGFHDDEIAKEMSKTARSVCLRRHRCDLGKYRRNTRTHRADSKAVIASLTETLSCVEAMLRSGTYSNREIEAVVREGLASESSPRSLSA